MRLKRIYEEVAYQGAAAWTGPLHKRTQAPLRVAGVQVLQARRYQKMTQNVIDGGIAEGWLSFGQGRATIHGVDGDVVYQVARTPGGRCCHCEAPVDLATAVGADGLTPGARHVRDAHGDTPSPDPQNPAGYRGENFYTLVRVDGGPEVIQSREDALAFDAQVREAFWTKIRAKYGATSLRPIQGGADLVFNIAKGRVVELYNRVDLNDPTNAALIILVIDAAGDADDTMRDRDTISALLGGTANEVTNGNYARKTLVDSDLVAFAPDDTNNWVDLDIPDQTWTAVAAGTAWTDFITAYDNDTTAGDDTNLVPLTLHDFAVTPDGSDITAQIAPAGFFRAS